MQGEDRVGGNRYIITHLVAHHGCDDDCIPDDESHVANVVDVIGSHQFDIVSDRSYICNGCEFYGGIQRRAL